MYWNALFVIGSLLCLTQIFYLYRLKKHDDVLFRFCETRRMIMKILRDRGFELPKDDYLVLRQLLAAVSDTIHNYDDCKGTVLNFRKLTRMARQLKDDGEEIKRFQSIKDQEIKEVISSFRWAMICAFFAYTPLFKSGIALSLLACVFRSLSRLGFESVKSAAAFLFWLGNEMTDIHRKPSKA